MAKKLTYSKVRKMKKRTKKFLKANIRLFNLNISVPVMQGIGKRRKENYEEYKKNFDALTVAEMANKDSQYLSALKERESQIMSGEYLEKRATSYIQNYLSSLRAMTIDQKIIDYIDQNPAIILEGILPEIDNYYVYLKGKGRTSRGKKYEVNVSKADDFEQSIKNTLKEYYGVDLDAEE